MIFRDELPVPTLKVPDRVLEVELSGEPDRYYAHKEILE